jgi:magnesium chelatase family protein
LVVGELSLDGCVRHIRGVLSTTALARVEGYQLIFVPQIDATEAELIPNLEVIPVPSLAELHPHLDRICFLPPQPHISPDDIPISVQIDF